MATGTSIRFQPFGRTAELLVGEANPLPVSASFSAAAVDSFARLRISNPANVFDSQLQYDKQPLLWDEALAGSATSTHKPNEAAVDLTVTTADGDSVVRQTREYFRYQPGKSQLILCTGVLGAAQSGTNKVVGYGDANNGIFFGQDGGGVYVLLRSKTSGTVSDARKVYQSDWNIDAMDGVGASGFTLDATKAQIFLMDLEWLGVGSVACALVINRSVHYVHRFDNANISTTTYMTTANLPVRYEITNTAAVAAAATLKQVCCVVVSEGGQENLSAFPFHTQLLSVGMGDGVGNEAALFSVRLAPTFNSIENRTKFLPKNWEVVASGGTIVTRVLYDAAITGGTWSAAAGGVSAMEVNTTATGYSGGIQVGGLIVPAGTTGSAAPSITTGRGVTQRLPYGLGIDGTDPTTLTLVGYALTAAVTGFFTFDWEEVR